jgi:hypothetical protein
MKNSLFDYIFYRVYQFFKSKGDSVSETKGSLILSLIQFLTALDVMVVVKIVHDYALPNKYLFLLPLILLGVINWYIYERDFDIAPFDTRWKNEENGARRRKGWMMLYLITAFLIPALYGYFKVNMNMF